VDDRLFATLDTKTRCVYLPDGREVLLTDTVGFIRHLPHGLVASFRSTLDVVSGADLLLVVADAGHTRMADHLDVVNETLEEIGGETVPSLLLFNKCDTADAAEALPGLRATYPGGLEVSARTGRGLDALKRAVAEELKDVVHHRDTDR
jgi:GTP-binding protein HflX